jgi:hypothetical protein
MEMADEQSAGRGHPRLVIVPEGGHATSDSPAALGYEAEFPLNAGRTTIGSGTGQDIVLDGLAAEHAVIDWIADGDEYVFEPLTSDGSATVDGGIATTGIHHGDRLQLGRWTLIFQRDEAADHIRLGKRARQGGEHAGDTRRRPGGYSTETAP